MKDQADTVRSLAALDIIELRSESQQTLKRRQSIDATRVNEDFLAKAMQLQKNFNFLFVGYLLFFYLPFPISIVLIFILI